MDKAPKASDHKVRYTPQHAADCVPCVADAEARREYRIANNPHRYGSSAAAAWDRQRAALDWAMDLRSETYWSA